MKYLTKLAFILFLAAGLTACSDFLKPSTPQQQPIDAINTVEDLRGVMNGAYSRLAQVPLYGRNYIIFGDVRTGNAFSNGYSGRFINYAQFAVTASGSGGIWTSAYEAIANCNLIIHSDVEGEGAAQIKGEAYGVRALAHMILLKVYGQMFVEGSNLGVPYVTKFAGNVEGTFAPSRLTVEKTLAKIEDDYNKALSLLSPNITVPVTRLTYYGVQALLSRFYLYTENYAAAAASAKDVINGGTYSLVPAEQYVESWAEDGKPAVIFEIAMTVTDNRGSNSIFQILAGEAYGDVEVTEQLYTLYGPDDVRNGLYEVDVTSRDQKVPRPNYRITKKYRSRLKNTPVIRYAEVILNYAEAQFQLGNLATALTFLNKIPLHRNADPYAAATLENILLERRKELSAEGIYYWQRLRYREDITRNSLREDLNSNEVIVPYGNYKLAFPIPTGELDANPNIKQNIGYRSE